MKIAYQVKIGKNKTNCEDHALISSRKLSQENSFKYDFTDSYLNEIEGEMQIDPPCIIDIVDGVGGNPGGYDASKFVVSNLSKKFRNLEFNKENISAAIIELNLEFSQIFQLFPNNFVIISNLPKFNNFDFFYTKIVII